MATYMDIAQNDTFKKMFLVDPNHIQFTLLIKFYWMRFSSQTLSRFETTHRQSMTVNNSRILLCDATIDAIGIHSQQRVIGFPNHTRLQRRSEITMISASMIVVPEPLWLLIPLLSHTGDFSSPSTYPPDGTQTLSTRVDGYQAWFKLRTK